MNCAITNEHIEEMYHTIDEARWDDLGMYFHDQIVYERPGYSPFIGLERVLQFYSSGADHRIRSAPHGGHGD